MAAEVIAIIAVGVSLAGLILSLGIFLASGQRRTQDQLGLLAERVASLETAIRFLQPSSARPRDAK